VRPGAGVACGGQVRESGRPVENPSSWSDHLEPHNRQVLAVLLDMARLIELRHSVSNDAMTNPLAFPLEPTPIQVPDEALDGLAHVSH
jgi:hypothetical protein